MTATTTTRTGSGARTALGLLALLALAGCADWSGISGTASLLDPDRLEAERSLAAETSPASWPRDDWWLAFQDPALDALVAEGLAASPDLKAAAARLRRAAALTGQARAALSPTLEGAGSVTAQRYTDNGAVAPPYAGSVRDSERLTLNGFYALDLWGGREAEFKAALGTERQSAVETQAARQDLAAAIARTYARYAGEYEQFDINADLLRQKEDIARLSGGLARAGLLSVVETEQAQAAISTARAELAESEGRLTRLRQSLAALAGAGPDRGLALGRPRLEEEAETGLPSRIPAELVGRRPDIVARRWRIEAASHAIDAAKARFYPNVDLQAFLGLDAIGVYNLFQASSTVAGIGPAVTLPIFDAGRLRAGLARAHAERDLAIEDYNRAVIDAVSEVAGLLADRNTAKAALIEEKAALARLDSAYRLALIRYREGLATYLTVLGAEEALVAGRRQEAALRTRLADISMALAHALGGGFDPAAGPAPALAGQP